MLGRVADLDVSLGGLIEGRPDVFAQRFLDVLDGVVRPVLGEFQVVQAECRRMAAEVEGDAEKPAPGVLDLDDSDFRIWVQASVFESPVVPAQLQDLRCAGADTAPGTR